MNIDTAFNCSINLLTAIDWQRQNADKLIALIQSQQNWMQKNHCDFWNNWITDVFDLRTANDFGLGVWSVILDEPVYGLTPPSPIDYPSWGFGPDRKNFNNGNFGTNDDSGYNFTTEQRRTLLQMKAFILHMSGCVSGSNVLSINAGLKRIFGENEIVCIDNLDMSFSYIVYDNTITGLIYELYSRDLLPRPACIEISIVYDGDTKSWGFGENHENFNNGNFYNGRLI